MNNDPKEVACKGCQHSLMPHSMVGQTGLCTQCFLGEPAGQVQDCPEHGAYLKSQNGCPGCAKKSEAQSLKSGEGMDDIIHGPSAFGEDLDDFGIPK